MAAAAATPWTADPAVEKYLSELPSGYRFHPTDGELVVDYLRNKILNLPMPLNRIRTFNIYNSHPLQLYQMYGVTARENACYFFTTRNKKYPKGTRTARKAGDGYWKSTTGDMAVAIGGTTVGSKRTLVYHQGTAAESVKTDWLMQEYMLNHNSLPAPIINGVDEYVLVKIYHKDMKNNTFVTAPKHEEEDGAIAYSTAHDTTDANHHHHQDNEGRNLLLIQQEEKPLLLNTANDDLHHPDQDDSGNNDNDGMIQQEEKHLLPSTYSIVVHDPHVNHQGNEVMNFIQQEEKVPILQNTGSTSDEDALNDHHHQEEKVPILQNTCSTSDEHALSDHHQEEKVPMLQNTCSKSDEHASNDHHYPQDDRGNYDGTTTTLKMIQQEEQPLLPTTTTTTTTREARAEDYDPHQDSNNKDHNEAMWKMKIELEHFEDVEHMLLSNFTYDEDLQSRREEQVELPPFPPSLMIVDGYSYPLEDASDIWSQSYHPQQMVLPASDAFANDAYYYYYHPILDNNNKRQKRI